MRYSLSGLRIVIVSAVFIVGPAIGAISINTTIASDPSNQSQSQTPNYPKNENGQTYGSGLAATSPETEPDLIEAYGASGTVGYVKSKDLLGDVPKTPEEAISIRRSLEQKGGVRQIPLYDVDGKTVIGVFELKPGISKDSPVIEK